MIFNAKNIRFSCHLCLFLAAGLLRSADLRYLAPGLPVTYTAALQAMKEPSLFDPEATSNLEQYRFVWLRTFHNPLAIRIYKDVDGPKARVVRLSGAAGYDLGHVDYDRVKPITMEQWDHFLSLLGKAKFVELPNEEKSLEPQFDGARWLLEGRSGKAYKVVERASPVQDNGLKSFAACCEYLLEISGLNIPNEEIY